LVDVLMLNTNENVDKIFLLSANYEHKIYIMWISSQHDIKWAMEFPEWNG